MINENLKLSGQLNIVLKDKAGNVKDTREVKNLVVNKGLEYIASRMKDASKGVMSHMALGSGTTAAAATQTDLVTLLGAREAIDSTTIAGSNNEKIVYVSAFEAGDATGAVTEAGIFNASTSGDMLCRTVFSVVNKAADDTMSVTWTITLSAS
tara:strand:- start:69 stop:527 length:459 start_codon:yes stop_codon:yes gene_type:complete